MSTRNVLVLDCHDDHTEPTLIRGVVTAARKVPDLSLTFVTTQGSDDLNWWLGLRKPLHGVIAPVRTQARWKMLKRAKVPVIDVYAALDPLPCPSVGYDEHVIGRLAAEHLMTLGYQSFGFVGVEESWSEGRYEGFAEALARRGFKCDCTCHGDAWWSWVEVLQPKHILSWMQERARPLGLLVSSDFIAAEWIAVLHQAGVRVPIDVAVVAADNNDFRCEFAAVPLTAVDTDPHTTGRTALELLCRLMDGHKLPNVCHRNPPRGLVVRASSDHVAHDDPDLNRAVRLINRNSSRLATVQELADDAAVSRRTLDRKFRRNFGVSPHEHLTRRRIARACSLLTHSEHKCAQIAELCGFRQPSHFSTVFKRIVGQTPNAYRAERQLAVAHHRR